jgi:hypothetical protein
MRLFCVNPRANSPASLILKKPTAIVPQQTQKRCIGIAPTGLSITLVLTKNSSPNKTIMPLMPPRIIADLILSSPDDAVIGASHFYKSTKLKFLKAKSMLKLGVSLDFINQSKFLGGITPEPWSAFIFP